jgi:aconitase A
MVWRMFSAAASVECSENLLRFEDGRSVRKADVEAVAAWLDNMGKAEESPSVRRVLMRDFTGVPGASTWLPCDAMTRLGGVRVRSPWCPSTWFATIR